MGLLDSQDVDQSGDIFLEERNVKSAHPMAMIFQDPVQTLDALMTVKQQCMELMSIYYPSWGVDKKRVIAHKKLVQVQLDVQDVWLKYPHQLSGGMCQRVGIALALLGEPLVLIADEPTTALDTTIQEEIVTLLLNLKAECSLACLFISHDVELVERVSDRVLFLSSTENSPVLNRSTSRIEGREFNRRVRDSPTPTGSPSLEKEKFFSKKIIEISHLSCVYHHLQTLPKQVFNNINLTLHEGEILGLVGPSGSGKSTLKKCILGLIPYKGNIEYTDLKPTDIQPIFQNPWASLNDKMTVKQQLKDILEIKGITNEQVLLDALRDVDLERICLQCYPSQMSGGQCQRVAIARALLLDPRVLIADEPTASLDASLREGIMDLLLSLREKKKMSLILISHDLKMVERVSNQIVRIS
jgi:ABC-type glutathione transport system ATPase component